MFIGWFILGGSHAEQVQELRLGVGQTSGSLSLQLLPEGLWTVSLESGEDKDPGRIQQAE